MTPKLAKRAPIPRVSIHNLSFEPNLTNIFKYLVLKTIRQNSLICPFLGLKKRKSSEFCRMVLDSAQWSIGGRKIILKILRLWAKLALI